MSTQNSIVSAQPIPVPIPIPIMDLRNLSQFSEDFLRKLFLCLSSQPNGALGWIFIDMLQNKTMEQIANKFLEQDDWDGNYLTSTTSALFNAFVCYKQNQTIDTLEALYLSTRGGSIGSYDYFDEDGNLTMIFVSPKDLIAELDGDGFFTWLNDLGDIAERNLYGYENLNYQDDHYLGEGYDSDGYPYSNYDDGNYPDQDEPIDEEQYQNLNNAFIAPDDELFFVLRQ
jgi:hypothetical protein